MFLHFRTLGVNQAANALAESLKKSQVKKNSVKKIYHSKNVTPYVVAQFFSNISL